jgi:hypothetical protein
MWSAKACHGEITHNSVAPNVSGVNRIGRRSIVMFGKAGLAGGLVLLALIGADAMSVARADSTPVATGAASIVPPNLQLAVPTSDNSLLEPSSHVAIPAPSIDTSSSAPSSHVAMPVPANTVVGPPTPTTPPSQVTVGFSPLGPSSHPAIFAPVPSTLAAKRGNSGKSHSVSHSAH